MKDLKVLFFGTSLFATSSLKALAENFNVVGVITQPDRPAGRGQKLKPSPVKELALELGLKVFQPEKINKEKKIFFNLNPDINVVVAYGQILSKDIIYFPRYKSLNLHASDLPFYRGAAPIQRALMNNETKTANTVMLMSPKMDEGDILSKEFIDIEEDDNFETLSKKLSEKGAILLVDTIKDYIKGIIKPIPQDHEKASYAMPILKEELKICWKSPAFSIHGKIRGLYPNAYTFLGEDRIKILKSSISQRYLLPGEIFIEKERIFVGTSKDAIEIIELTSPKGKVLKSHEFLKGYYNLIKTAQFFT